MKRLILLIFFLPFVTSAQTPELIFVFLNKRIDKAELPEGEVKKIMEGHMANIERLSKEGKLISAGPFDGGGGIFIFKSKHYYYFFTKHLIVPTGDTFVKFTPL